MPKYAIVVIGYNRVKSMLRLLNSLNRAEYDGDRIPLIISIDHSDDDAIVRAAEAFKWEHGEKMVRTFPERQGLRRHVLKCGEYLQEYDAIAVWEDDLYASPGFYQYMKEAVPFYEEDNKIAGLSLYSHRWNVLIDRAFEPMRGCDDIFFMQFAQSWGQIWMKRQWRDFCSWYEGLEKDAMLKKEGMPGGMEDPAIPLAVRQWPESSWLKYHVAYCILNGKYFVYPYDSLSTNYSDAGENSRRTTWRYQVAMQMAVKRNYRFAPCSEESIRYDGFFESRNVAASLGLREDELCVDLYGSKPGNMSRRYWLTSRKDSAGEKKAMFGMQMRPPETNILCGVEGDDFVLYETDACQEAGIRKPSMREIDYDIRGEGLSLKNIPRWVAYRL